MKLNLGIFTVARSDFGILRKTILRFETSKKFNTTLYVGSAHKTKIFGKTSSEFKDLNIKKKFFKFQYKSSDISSIIKYFSKTITETERLIKNDKLNAIIVMGDRYEMLAISFVALNLNIPIIHLCGGSITLGSLDDIYRNSITKMASLHLVETIEHKRNLVRLGIKKNIFIVGAPALENILNKNDYKKIDFESKKPLLCNFHPETNIGINKNLQNLKVLISYIKKTDEYAFISYPNADHGYKNYINLINKSFKRSKKVEIVKNFGLKNYYKALTKSKILIGNSSSGIIESASFNLPCINLGNRQKGRYAPKNVLNSDFKLENIQKKYKIASSKKFIQHLEKYKNPYYSSNTSKKVFNIIYKFLKNKL